MGTWNKQQVWNRLLQRSPEAVLCFCFITLMFWCAHVFVLFLLSLGRGRAPRVLPGGVTHHRGRGRGGFAWRARFALGPGQRGGNRMLPSTAPGGGPPAGVLGPCPAPGARGSFPRGPRLFPAAAARPPRPAVRTLGSGTASSPGQCLLFCRLSTLRKMTFPLIRGGVMFSNTRDGGGVGTSHPRYLCTTSCFHCIRASPQDNDEILGTTNKIRLGSPSWVFLQHLLQNIFFLPWPVSKLFVLDSQTQNFVF